MIQNHFNKIKSYYSKLFEIYNKHGQNWFDTEELDNETFFFTWDKDYIFQNLDTWNGRFIRFTKNWIDKYPSLLKKFGGENDA
jgi:hypothetical protein